MIYSETDLTRPALVPDAPKLARLRAASLIEQGLMPEGDAAHFVPDATLSFARLLRDRRLAAWLLEIDGDAVGSAAIVFWERLPYARTSLHAELAGVYVVGAFRRRGFARDLCVRAIDYARECGVRWITVHPSPSGERLYRDLGFNDTRTLELRS